jgi:hypothetical protein
MINHTYFVIVRASAAYNAMAVACGNLAPPTPQTIEW